MQKSKFTSDLLTEI